MLTSFHVPFENLATCSSKTYVLELYDTVYDKATNPPSVIHGWKATDLLYEMVRRKNYWRNPISRQNFANALAENHNLKLEVCLTTATMELVGGPDHRNLGGPKRCV